MLNTALDSNKQQVVKSGGISLGMGQGMDGFSLRYRMVAAFINKLQSSFLPKQALTFPWTNYQKGLACNTQRKKKKISQWLSRADVTQFSCGGLEMFLFLQGIFWDGGAMRNSSAGTMATRSTTRNSSKQETCTGHGLELTEGRIRLLQ